MKPSIFKLVDEASLELKTLITSELNRVLKQYGIPDKERKIKFAEFDNPTLAAVLCHDILCELTKIDKSYFTMEHAVYALYKNISRTIKAEEYEEKIALKEMKKFLTTLTFDSDYYRNDFGYYITKDNKFGGYIFDNSMGSPTTKISSMIKAKAQFEIFTLSERNSVEFEFNILSKEQLEASPYLKNQFLAAVEAHNLPELIKVSEEYGYSKPKEETSSAITKSSIFGA